MTAHFHRRFNALTVFLNVLLLVTAFFTVAPSAAQDEIYDIRIGYQKGDYLTVLKAQGTLEKLFEGKANITWTVFPAGPQLLEALNVGAIDIGATGETPPIFAQAAGAPLVYIATQLGSGAGQALIVPADSPITSVADLEGKTIAFNKASSAHLFTVRALEAVGLSYNDITPAFLPPADARAAFQGGSVDAWVIWDPFLAAAQQEIGAKIIVDGKDLAETRNYYEAAQAFVDAHPDAVEAIVKEIQKAGVWVDENREAAAQILSDETGVELAVWVQALTIDQREVTYIDQSTIDYQQKVADTFFDLELIPEAQVIADVVWAPEGKGFHAEPSAEPTADAEATVEPTAEATAES